MLKVLDLFSGIGGFSLGLERTGGFETVAFCEIDKFCQKVLKKHWPHVPIYEDIRELSYDGQVDIITGGFPCQDISYAGNGAGLYGERSGLWREFKRIIGELRPKYAILENVPALLTRGLGDVLADLAEVGYDAEWHCISAAYVGRPQLRDRIWIIAYPNERALWAGWFGRMQNCKIDDWEGLVLPTRGRKHNGIPDWLDRVGSCGNAVTPKIPEMIGRLILEAEGRKTEK